MSNPDDRSLEMDAITAHLDRGWDRVQQGDLGNARLSAQQILELDAESPEAHTLLGAIAAAEGDFDQALELLRQAMDLDGESLEPVLYAAEVAVLRGDCDGALELCRLGRELIDDPESELDVGLLELEALIASDRLPEALRVATALPDVTASPVPSYWLRAGRAWLDLGDPVHAEPLLRRATEHADSEADARYFLGLCLEQQGRSAESLRELMEVCDLDRQQPEPAWSYSAAEFEELLRRTIEGLPPELREPLSGAPARVAAHPPPELVAEGMDPRAMVFLAGIRSASPDENPGAARSGPGARRGQTDAAAAGAISCVFVYKRPLERFARSGADVPLELRAALEEEARLVLRLPAEDS